ncbi:glycosyltransferase [Endozoicomonas sp. SESOKO1]|uniref:glycosyltransferase n=1 Tax=Endozoicomonas sp. SESOKO1 TaxID=2828742 RepID=UPI0021489C7E|nr:glycosyltransferase [Endozoicomonas sp. SESOKO1]
MKVCILHIVESFGGGVTSAINSYVENSTQFDHHLIASVRENDATGEENQGDFKSVHLLARSLKSIIKVFHIVNEIKPDVVHLHSTYAGFIFRILPIIPKDKIIYTPHAFAFLRDQHKFITRLYSIIEKILAKRTAIIAGCSRDEKNIALDFLPEKRTAEIINICEQIISDYNKKSNKHTIVMVGRMCNQKGFHYYLTVAKNLSHKYQFKWIGGGDEFNTKLMQEAGVEVTGWLHRSEVINQLATADLYFHTAAWEGFPISVLEVAKLEIPLILRDIGTFTAEDLNVVNSIDEAETEIDSYFSGDQKAVMRAQKNYEMINEYHTKENLKTALDNLYNSFK